ncbi:unnamed protein product [Cylicocyclus nassatus]|uniref:AMP-dependent synthetase/ligase domain-containing protein n=1 Tax=Cylicocyclus nassatus TaxID=53992 RepID=A0AA36HAD7_CYLNA|nr:unnamed protein product [Cylicocyclus nassatus]
MTSFQLFPDPNFTTSPVDVDQDPVFMPYSSGTTGPPKGVMLTHKNYSALMSIYGRHDELRMLGGLSPPWCCEKDRELLLLPFYHCFGFALMMSSILKGGTSVVMSHFHPQLFCESVQNFQRGSTSWEGSVRGTEEEIQKHKGTSSKAMGQPVGSVGKLVSNLEMKIVDPEDNTMKARGEIGEICIRGPTVMLGYFGKPEATKECIRDGFIRATLQFIICVGDEPSSTFPSNCYQWNDVLSTVPDPNFTTSPVDVDQDPVFMPYSSGTTGPPKGVMLTHKNYSALMSIYGRHDELRMLGGLSPPWCCEKDRELLLLPFYHCFGFAITALMMSSILKGGTSVVMSHFHPQLFLRVCTKFQIRFVAVVPPILVFLVKNPICERYDLSSLQFIFSGGSTSWEGSVRGTEEEIQKHKAHPARPDTLAIIDINQWNLSDLNINDFLGYGMSELSMGSHLPDITQGQPVGSVGKLVSNLEMKIVDPEDNTMKARGEIGEICIRVPQ